MFQNCNNMKKLFFAALIFTAASVQAQEASEIKPAAKGVIYGEAVNTASAKLPPGDVRT